MDEQSTPNLHNLTEKFVSPGSSPVLPENILPAGDKTEKIILPKELDPGSPPILPEDEVIKFYTDPEMQNRLADIFKSTFDRMLAEDKIFQLKTPYNEKLFLLLDKVVDNSLEGINDKKVSDLAEKTHLTPEQVRDYMCVRLAAASQIKAERSGRYPRPILRILEKIQPDKFDITKIIEDKNAVDQFLNEDGLNSFYAPVGDENDWHTSLWKDMVNGGKDIAAHQPGYFTRTIDSYRESGSLPSNPDSPAAQAFRTSIENLKGK